jgi:hypothetical protein
LVILTQETYAIDMGDGMTVIYYYTVIEKAATQFFNSPEFKKAIEKSLAYHPEPALPIPANSQ